MKIVTLTCCAMMAGAASSLAADKPELSPKERAERLFAEIDKNKDGTIAYREFKEAPLVREAKRKEVESVFHTIDANLNGSLDKTELAKGFDKIRAMLQNSRAVMDDGDSRSSRRQLRRILRD
jgi:Ca2+-binding EF-hand superfamily protein